MKTEEDEAFDELARKQGMWGGGFKAKQAMAADKLQEPAQEVDYWIREATAARQAEMALRRELEAQPAQEPYDQTALELCNVCGWKTLIPDDCCLNCERAQPAQEPDWKTLPPRDAPLVQWAKEQTAPPQREWVGLTNDEVNNLAAGCHLGKSVQGAIYEAAAKLKEKNA